ncbi:MAG: hypothetical protein ABI051_09970 [Vicinamibacterales bacterium]
MWRPRLSGAYKLGEKIVIKGGWGLYFDTLSAADFDAHQLGYSATTTNNISTDFGRTWLFGDPRDDVSPLTEPSPVRADGARFESPVGSALGLDTVVGSSYSVPNLNRKHVRQHSPRLPARTILEWRQRDVQIRWTIFMVSCKPI